MQRRQTDLAGFQCSQVLATACALMFLLDDSAFSAPSTVGELEGASGVAGLSLLIVLVIFVAVTVLLHLHGRQQWLRRENQLLGELADARNKVDRAQIFLAVERHITVGWHGASDEPDIEGDLSLVTDSPNLRRLLGFGSWLEPEMAQKLDHCVERLRQRGEAFQLSVVSLTQRHLEIEGRAVGGRAVMRIRDVSGSRLELARVSERYSHVLSEIETLRTLLDTIADPVWVRNSSGTLQWVNHAYVTAVEGKDAAHVVAEGRELFDRPVREAATQLRQQAEIWRLCTPAVVSGERRTMDALEVPVGQGAVGMARDLSELVSSRAELERQMDSHRLTLDKLSTAVAIFDRNKRLIFHNTAYRQLWALPVAFLEQNPSENEILDLLRGEHKLPEQADFKAWKSDLMAAYQSLEAHEQIWHLPDTRTLRMVVAPNPQGGITYLFDNVTERFELESRYNGLIRVQGETLDTLKEGVAVFGMDGKVKLQNPAFATIWHLNSNASVSAEDRPADGMHIDQLIRQIDSRVVHQPLWKHIRDVVVGLPEQRYAFTDRIERGDGLILDCSAIPLPDGATLATFSDVTGGVHFERALTERSQALVERNQALIDAEKLRNDFVHHVSYELRSPLTNIIGFTQLIAEGTVGPLNEKQQEYAGYIMESSSALMAIINDILDLATIDMDVMELDLTEVDIALTLESVIVGVQDRISEAHLQLQVVVPDNIGTMRADAKRLRQILFNLLSNAIGFSNPGQSITLAALRRENEVVFKVSDHGRGIPPDILDKVFDRFLSQSSGSTHRGLGLGLAIVKSFIELHGGRVSIDSVLNEGTIVTCSFPINATQIRQKDHPEILRAEA